MERLVLPRKTSEYIPVGIYGRRQEERKRAFLDLFPVEKEENAVNERRMDNLKELRGDYR